MPAALAAFKLVCNAWPLAGRFGDRGAPCPFCDGGAETIEHLASCGVAKAFVERHLGRQSVSFVWGGGAMAVVRHLSRHDTFVLAAITAECILHSALRRRFHSAAPRLLMHARLRELCRRFPRAFPGAVRPRRRPRRSR